MSQPNPDDLSQTVDQPTQPIEKSTDPNSTQPFFDEAETGSVSESTGNSAPGIEPHTQAQSGEGLASSLRQFGDYSLDGEIARGGMGVVYRARQLSLNRPVALKMILSAQLASDADVQRFRTEAEAAANLDHPGIVPVFEVGEIDGQHFFSMGLVEGGSLADRVKEGGLSPSEAAGMVMKIARAVHYAHARNIVHRDLKPANVLLDEDGQPRVTDFGLAKNVQGGSGVTLSGQILGTPSYMAPEQAAGRIHEVGPLADVWSLGGILYALLTGRPPFQGNGVLETLREVMEKEPVSPRQLNPGVDSDLETICLKCLRKEPEKRYSSAAELAEDLRRYVEGKPVQARRLSGWERLQKWVKRRPAAAVLVMVLGLSIVGMAILAGALWHNAEQRAQAVQDLDVARSDLSSKRMELQQLEEQSATARSDLDASREHAGEVNYLANMKLVQESWETANVTNFLRLLQAEKPGEAQKDRRRFEWYYWHHSYHRGHLPLREHQSGIRTLAFSPDGKLLASGGGGIRAEDPGELLIWDFPARKVLHRLALPTRVTDATFSRDGRFLAAGSGNHSSPGEVKIWQLKKRPELIEKIPDLPDQVDGLGFHPDGRFLALGGGFFKPRGYVRIWDLQKKRTAFALTTNPVQDLSFRPDGEVLATAHKETRGEEDAQVAFWKIDSSGALTRQAFTIETGDRRPLALAYDHQGKQLAVGLSRSRPGYAGVQVWNLEAEKELYAPMTGHTGRITHVSFSPDDRRIASSSFDHTVRIWDASSGMSLISLRGDESKVYSALFDPLSKDYRLITGGADGNVRIRLGRVDPAVTTFRGHQGEATCVAFHPEGRRFASAGFDSTVRVWEVEGKTEPIVLADHSGRVRGVCFSPNGKLLATASGRDPQPGEINVWDWANRRLIQTFRGHSNRGFRVVFHPDGQRLASVSGGEGRKGEIKLWSLKTGKEIQLPLRGHQGVMNTVAFSPDGNYLAWGGKAQKGRTGVVRIWNLSTNEQMMLLTDYKEQVSSLEFSRDGKLLAIASIDGIIQIRQAPEWKLIHTLTGHWGRIHSVSFGPEGRRLVSSGQGSPIRVWNLQTGHEVLTLKGHETHVWSVAFGPKGCRIASACQDGTVKVWDGTPATTPEGVGELKGEGE